MQIIQMLPTISYGDAVSNDTLALEKVIKRMGYKTKIYAESVDVRLPKGTAYSVNKMPKLKAEDIVIFHMSTGAELNWTFGKLPCRKIMIYHNITPPSYLKRYNTFAAQKCEEGLESLRYLADKVDYCMAVSEYNKHDLEQMGFTCRIDVLPIIIPFGDYDKMPNSFTLRKYQDDYTNILFTGRLSPNKCQEDVIRSFAFYQKYYNPKSRLFLVGSDSGFENYRKRLASYGNALGAEHIIFPGHIKFDEVLAYYKLADVFLCQSEHEGFCVPLVEAMYFDIPIIAYDAAAIAGTLGGSGIVRNNKNALETAGVIDKVVSDEKLRATIRKNQRERLEDFDNRKIEQQFEQLLQKYVFDSGDEKKR